MARVVPKEVTIIQTRKTGLGLDEPRAASHRQRGPASGCGSGLKGESVSVNAIVISMLEEFFKQLRKESCSRGQTPAGDPRLPNPLTFLITEWPPVGQPRNAATDCAVRSARPSDRQIIGDPRPRPLYFVAPAQARLSEPRMRKARG